MLTRPLLLPSEAWILNPRTEFHPGTDSARARPPRGFGHAEILLRGCVATLGVVIEKELLRASGMLPRPQEPEEE